MEAFGPKNWTQFQKKHPEYYNIIDTHLMFPINIILNLFVIF